MRADYLNENSTSTYSLKDKTQLLSAAVTLTEKDSNKGFYVESSGGAYSVTFPTGADIEDGIYYKFGFKRIHLQGQLHLLLVVLLSLVKSTKLKLILETTAPVQALMEQLVFPM